MDYRHPYRITFILCLAEIFGLASMAAFPALLPVFQAEWRLSNTEAGWINAGYYAGYMILVPVMTGVTDRIDARKMMGLGAGLGLLASTGYAFFAQGFKSALVFRFISGISLAGIYMPGLKVVGDHTQGRLQSRFVSFYTASFSIGAALSYLFAGEAERILGWRWAFGICGLITGVAFFIVLFFVPATETSGQKQATLISNFKTVLRSRSTMAYVAGYAVHMWELFSFRAWVVAFLTFSARGHSIDSFTCHPSQIAFLVNLIGLPASIGGNELSRRFGRRRVIMAVMALSASLGCLIGFTTILPFWFTALLTIFYGVSTTGDSASLTAGTVAAAPPQLKGSALAVHSTLGFGAAFLSPLAVGVVLDVFNASPIGWAMAFITMAAPCVAGPFLLHYMLSGGETDSGRHSVDGST